MEQPETTAIFVISSDHEPIHICVGDLRDVIPIGRDHDLDNRLLPALETADGIRWRKVGAAGGEGDAGGRAALAADPPFDPEPIIDGTVDAVTARLAELTPDQLLRVRDAEADREVSRSTVLRAIDKAIAAAN